MKQLLLLGIGRSSTQLITYLQSFCNNNDYLLIAVDQDARLVHHRIEEYPDVIFHYLPAREEEALLFLMEESDVVISLLPPAAHLNIAKHCLRLHKPFFTASYVTPEIQALHKEATAKNLLFLMECGLDPGLDHMSALDCMHRIVEDNGVIVSFKSYTGGLIHPNYANPPWNYKISWNPRNVVLAGQGAHAEYLDNEVVQSIPYKQLFKMAATFNINGQSYEGYPNRNSLAYQSLYGLDNVHTLIRGTLRYPGYCEGWDYLIQIGITDDTIKLPIQNRTIASFFKPYLEQIPPNDIQKKYIQALGAFESIELPEESLTAAELLQKVLELKWALQPNDLDRVVMMHEFVFKKNNQLFKKTATLLVDGTPDHTAMSTLVGLPLAIAVELYLENQFTLRGVQRPIDKQFYVPLLQRLSGLGVQFEEVEIALEN
jgi:saccharopine dehydrogenase-like NADP-dependent oxidoreductase